jgi:hypothetical protein
MTRRSSQRGSAMLITLILISAILAGAAVLVSLQLSANKGAEITNTGVRALHCAEAGLAAVRTTVANNQASWAGNIGTGIEPSWLASISHDIGDGGSDDFYITLEDDQDEYPTNGSTNNNTVDVNNKVFLVSRCGTMVSGVFVPKYADFPREVRELQGVTNQFNCYNAQKGGCGGNNTFN